MIGDRMSMSVSVSQQERWEAAKVFFSAALVGVATVVAMLASVG